MATETKVSWLSSLDEAKKMAAGSGKPILMFFHYKYCTGCINTFNKTLTRMSVIDSINGSFVPVLFETTENEKLVKAYGVEWTPTFIIADETALELDRWEGYLPEDDFLGHIEMALARVALKKGDYKGAERVFDGILLKFPLSDLAPKAGYYRGVARYRATKDPAMLTMAYEDLKSAYPDSIWSIKASVWSKENIESLKKAA
jgi:thioredoxin-related protein